MLRKFPDVYSLIYNISEYGYVVGSRRLVDFAWLPASSVSAYCPLAIDKDVQNVCWGGEEGREGGMPLSSSGQDIILEIMLMFSKIQIAHS